MKDNYGIKLSLDRTMLDSEIVLKSKKHNISAKPLKIKVILMWVIAIVVYLYAVFQSPIGKNGAGVSIAFTLVYVWFALSLLKTNKAGDGQYEMVKTVFDYIPKYNRVVNTRTSANAYNFYGIVGIQDISLEGLITYEDGTYGQVYEVVGSASVLLFDEDRAAITDRVDKFYRQMKSGYEIYFITKRQAQKVNKQVGVLYKKASKLPATESGNEIRELINLQYQTLKNKVGGSYKSLHQFMIIKADSKESLGLARTMLNMEASSSNMMFKQVIALNAEGIRDLLREIYSSEEKIKLDMK